jgi:glycerol-3-phosphate dehydrogenase
VNVVGEQVDVVVLGAGSWGGQLAPAVRAGLPVSTLADHVDAFPTWSEAIGAAARELAAALAS